VKEAGVKVLRPDTEPFAEKVQPLYERYKDQEEVYHYIQRIQEAADTLGALPDTSELALQRPE